MSNSIVHAMRKHLAARVDKICARHAAEYQSNLAHVSRVETVGSKVNAAFVLCAQAALVDVWGLWATEVVVQLGGNEDHNTNTLRHYLLLQAQRAAYTEVRTDPDVTRYVYERMVAHLKD